MSRSTGWVDHQKRCKELLWVAMVSAVVSLVLSATGFGTNEWTVVSVDRETLARLAIDAGDNGYLSTMTADYNYFSRKRGLFQICFQDNNDTEFIKNEEFYKSGKCLHEPAIESSTPKASWGSNYRRRNDMMRTHVALLGIGLGFLFLCFIIGLATCCCLTSCVLLATSICSVIAFFSAFTGMIIYHIYDDNENHNLDYKPFYFYWSKDTTLKANSSVDYGFSFYLTWIGTAFCLICTVLFWASTFAWMEYKKELQARSEYDRKFYYNIDNYAKRRSRKNQRFKYIPPPSGEYLRDYYLGSREPSFTGSDGRLYPVPGRRLPPYHRPYDYYDYYNIYGSSGVYPY